MENVPREQHKEGTQPFFVFFFLLGIRVRIIFNLRARVVQRNGTVYCLVPCRVPSWLIGVHPTSVCVCLCVLECVCVSPGSCLPSVCLPWIGLLSPSQWRATQPGWIFFPPHLLQIYQSQAIQRLLYGAVSSTVTASYNTHTLTQLVHLYTLAQMSTQTQRTPVLHSCALLHFLNIFKFTFFPQFFPFLVLYKDI